MEKLFNDAMNSAKEVQAFWENRTSQILDEFVKSQTFVNAMTSSLESMLDVRKTMDTSITRWAETFQVVSKKDVDNLSRQMYENNLKLGKIIELLGEIRDQHSFQATPSTQSAPQNPPSRKKDRTER